MSIYIVELEQSRYFVYSLDHYSDDPIKDEDILKEIEIIYEFAQKYKPMRIANKYIKTSPFQLDNTVKTLMMEHGINMVRGGTYVSETLSATQIQFIQREFSTAYFPKNLKDNIEYRFLLKNYLNRKWSREEACFEMAKIYQEYDAYLEIKKMSDKIPEFDRDNIVYLFAELRQYCSKQHFPSFEEIASNDDYCDYWIKTRKESIPELYYSILKISKMIFTTYFVVFPSDDCSTKDILLKYPKFILDPFFIHKMPGTRDKIDDIYVFCDNMLYMMDKLYTFKMKLLGEILGQRIPNIEWTIPRIQHFLL